MQASRLAEVLRSARAAPPAADDVTRLRALLAPHAAAAPKVAPASSPRELGPFGAVVARGAARTLGEGPPNVMLTLGRHRSLFRAWTRFSGRLMPFGLLPRAEAELVILRVAWQSRSAYEWHQHVRIGLGSGLTADEVAAVADGTYAWSPRQAAVLAAVDELLDARELSDATVAALRASGYRDRELIELCLLVGNYQGLATALGGLGVEIERV
jgi:alkylhydroperoxidase family enzyme